MAVDAPAPAPAFEDVAGLPRTDESFTVSDAFLRSPHVQTLGAALPVFAPPRAFVKSLQGTAEVVRIPLPASSSPPPREGSGHEPHDRDDVLAGAREDGALLAKAWRHRRRHASEGPRRVVAMFHGVGGSTESRYMVRAAVAFFRAGYDVLRVNLRGAGDGVVWAPSLYHAGIVADVDAVASALAADPSVSRIVLLGFSLGGNVLLRAAGAWKDAVPFKVEAVVSVSAPLDLTSAARNLERAATFPYRRFIVAGLASTSLRFKALHPERARFYKRRSVLLARTVRDSDEAVIVPMWGFGTAAAYYEEMASGPALPHIRVPTLIIHAADDPMVPADTVRPWLPQRSSAVDVVMTREGGHVGFFAGWNEERWVTTWALERALDFFQRDARPAAAAGAR